MISVLYPSDPLNERVVDEEFAAEKERLRYSDFNTFLINQDALAASHDVLLRPVPEGTDRVLYRGWMLDPAAYASLEAEIAKRGLALVTSTQQYRNAHWLPGWIEHFAAVTPRTAVLPADATDAQLLAAARSLNADAFIVKDYVKSRKHEWATACFAPDVSAVPSIVGEFIRLQGEYLAGGIVIREYMKLDQTMPEIRVWWANGTPIFRTVHPDFDQSLDAPVIPERFMAQLQEMVQTFDASFITSDIAWQADTHEPLLIEVGDGQVSGMAANVSDAAYEDLLHALES